MIVAPADIAVNGPVFAALACGLVLLAWSKQRRHFVWAFPAVSLAVVASWLSVGEALALAAFLLPPYAVVRHTWGRPEQARPFLVGSVVAFEVVLFVVLRKYDWVPTGGLLDHHLAIVGLSFMLFRVVHLVIDAPQMGDLRVSLWRYLAYILAFWTLFAGPIQRYRAFHDGLAGIGRPQDREALKSAHRVANGLIAAFIVAPLLLPLSDISLLKAETASTADWVIVFYAYPIYLYLNFAGYTDVMIGLSRLCGFRTMPENFNRPYLARNVQDFWGRWHMTLGTWTRDYVFYPFSKSLVPRMGGTAGITVAVLVTFFLLGAWHGTTMNFVVFGLLHGLAVIAAGAHGAALKKLLGKKRKKAFEVHPLVRGAAILLCFHYVCATFLVFPNSLTEVADILAILIR